MSEVIVRELRVTDASALSDLFARCYGDTYGSPVFYDVPALATRIREGVLRSVVAEDGSTLIGHTGITIRHPGALCCETGNTVVDPDSRGQGLLKKLGRALRERVLREGFIGYVHYPTTAHEIMQRASVTGGGVETGVMLAYIAETTNYEAVETRRGRLAATVAYQPFARAPERTVVLPTRYASIIRGVYELADLGRSEAKPDSSASQEGARIVSTSHAERGLLHVFAGNSGADLAERVGELIHAHEPGVTHVDLPLDDPFVNHTVDRLTDLGFIFCAVLPEFARTDVLRLQALHEPVEGDFYPDVVNSQAMRYCEFMRENARAFAEIKAE